MIVAPEQIQISCPACATPMMAEVWRVVDVGQQPDLKRQLLRGQLNVAACPNCSNLTAVATPLAYHDPDKELFLILVPTQLGLSGDDQEKAVGELTNLVLNSLPAEQRKGYLFQPKTFFSMDSLHSDVLRAEGITDEMMQDQKEKSQLILDLLAQLADEASLKKLVEDNKDRLDYEFFLYITASIEQAREDNQQDLVEQLTALRAKLQEMVGPAAVPPQEEMKGAITREELIERLLSFKNEEEFKTLVAVARPALDYQFYQLLTGQIEAAESQGEPDKAQELTELRSSILDLVEELDREAKEALDRGAALLRQIVDSEDMEAAALQNIEQIDAAFLTALEASIMAADQSDQQETLATLNKLKEHIVSLLEARMPPEMRLINQLLSTRDGEERNALLQEQQDLINEDFAKLLDLIVHDLRSQGQEDAAVHLSDVVEEVEAMVQAQGSDSTEEQDSEESPP
jgi:hypothetical protein